MLEMLNANIAARVHSSRGVNSIAPEVKRGFVNVISVKMLSANIAARVPLEPRGQLNCTQSQKWIGECRYSCPRTTRAAGSTQ